MCNSNAQIIEFQKPIRGEEPALPINSDSVAKYFCVYHRPISLPESWIEEAAKHQAETNVVARARNAAEPMPLARATCKVDSIAATRAKPDTKPRVQSRQKSAKPHIDPNWGEISFLPPGSKSSTTVQCSSCHDEHHMANREMFNGSYSECPACGDNVYTLAWSQEAAG